MIQENELLTLILSLGATGFVLLFLNKLRAIPGWKTLLVALGALLFGNIATILEGFFWPHALNVLEHGSHSIVSVALLFWILRYGREEP